MNGHVVDALLGLLFDHFEHDVGVQIFDALDAGDGFVDRDGADRERANGVDDGFANVVDVAAGGEIHDGVGAVVHGGVQLLQLFVDVPR